MERRSKIALGVVAALSLGLAAAVVGAQPGGYGPGGYGPGSGMGGGLGGGVVGGGGGGGGGLGHGMGLALARPFTRTPAFGRPSLERLSRAGVDRTGRAPYSANQLI